MAFVAVKVFGLFLLFSMLVLYFAFVFHVSLSIWIPRPFALFILPFLVFGRIDIGHAMDAIHDLDAIKFHSPDSGLLDDPIQQLLKHLHFSTHHQSLAKDRQSGMIRRFSIHGQSNKIFGWQIFIHKDFHLSFGQVLQIRDQFDFQKHGWIEWRLPTKPSSLYNLIKRLVKYSRSRMLFNSRRK
jgi:hypothetical protein